MRNTEVSGGRLDLPSGSLRLPVYLPDATYGVVRSVEAEGLERCGIEGLVMNTFHLMQRPGSSTIRALGGLHAMSGWKGPIITDSGGFQAYSLISQNPRRGGITENGISFQPEGADRKFQLTPEKTVQLQLAYGSDVVICLDDVTHVDAPMETQEAAVRRTIAWARRCKQEYVRILGGRDGATPRPLIFGVIQGGGSRELRRRCAEELLELGFDGYGYGGWPLDAQGNLLSAVFEYVRELVPPTFPLHALGVGHPENVAACIRIGYAIFDSALPTRDARQGRLYVVNPEHAGGTGGRWFRYIYIADDKHIKRSSPIDPACDCPACTRYSVGYLRHLFKIGEVSFQRLATLHNLRTMTRLTDALRVASGD